jgi:hypothetical protein
MMKFPEPTCVIADRPGFERLDITVPRYGFDPGTGLATIMKR